MSKNRHRNKVRFPATRVPIVNTLLDILIVTGGRWDMLEKCLRSIKETVTVPYHIIVVDNATPMEELKANEAILKGIQVKRTENRMSFAEANNYGAFSGRSPLLLLLNDDVELLPGCVDTMVRRMDDPNIGVCGAKLLFPETSSSPIRPAGLVQHVGMAININAAVIHPLIGWDKNHPKTNISREVMGVTGACFMTRRNLWMRLGGLDVAYRIGTYEEVDYCLKVRQLGSKIFIDTNAVAYHYAGATAEKNQVNFPMQINAMLFINRWSASGLLQWDDWTFW